jgi:hypothetical protein
MHKNGNRRKEKEGSKAERRGRRQKLNYVICASTTIAIFVPFKVVPPQKESKQNT